MKHHDSKRKLGRRAGPRRALLKSLALSLIINGKIKTTEAKAKELRPFIEKLVTKAKIGTLAARRIVISTLLNRDQESKKLVDEIAPRFKERNGGYTRITKLAEARKGDASDMAVIEFVD